MRMSYQERTRRLAKMLKQIAPDADPANLREVLQSSSPTSATEALDSLNASDEEFAVESLDALISNGIESIDHERCEALEAIIHRRYRPALYVIDNSYRGGPAPWDKILEGPARKRIEEAIPAVGRIDLPNHPSLPYAGTGFVVGKSLLMTNRHVAANFVSGRGDHLVFVEGQTALVDFKQEQASTASATLRIVKPLMIHPYWDMALLEVEGLPESTSPLRLSVADTDELRGGVDERYMVIIGYPAQSPYNDYHDQMRIFEQFDVKRLQPGVLRERRLHESYGRQVNAVTHDCSTLCGNSGSVLLDIESGEVVGLHFAGVYLDANFAVPSFELARDGRVVQAGVNFVASATPSADYQPFWDELPEPPNPRQTRSKETISVSTTTSDLMLVQSRGEVDVTIPLHISLTFGEPQLRSTTTSSPPSDEGLLGMRRPQLEAEPTFDISSLGEASFNWRTTLALAMASQLAYDDKLSVQARAISHWGFSSCSFIDRNRTQCFVAVTGSAIVVSFRGTKELSDWLTNLDALSTSTEIGSVHAGFWNAFEAAAPVVTDVIDRVSSRPILLTGHSLGGAIAALAACVWSEKYPVNGVYTFGQPAVGRNKKYKETMRQRLSGKMFRFVNDDDVVPKVPPLYAHVGTLYHFDGNGELKASRETVRVTDDMLTKSQFIALQQQIKASEEAGIGTEGLLPSVADHAIERYIARVAWLCQT